MTTPKPDEQPPDISDEARALAGLYLATRQADLDRLDRAVAAGDFAAIQSVGHAFKGSSAMFGFPEAGRIGEQIEEAAARADREAVAALALLLRASIPGSGPQAL